MYTLGINAAFHDPAACLVADGELIAAAAEERFTRIKHGKRPVPFSTWELPFHAIDYVLKEAGINLVDVDHVAYSFDPYLLLDGYESAGTITLPLEPSAVPTAKPWHSPWDPLFVSSIVNAPRHLMSGAPHWLEKRFQGASLNGAYQWHFVEHHLAHAASAFLASPFERAATFTVDGRGERATTTYGIGAGNHVEIIGEVCMPDSLGLLYEAITEYLGFMRSSDEYKVMALACFGEPVFVDAFREIVEYRGEGQYVLKPGVDYAKLFGPPRQKGEPFEQRHFDVAHGLQAVLEETVMQILDWLHERTGEENLVMAGGVALNCVMNRRVREEGPFSEVWVQPAAGDDGTALGAALWVDAQQRGERGSWWMDHCFYGPGYTEDEIESLLKWSKLDYRRSDDIAAETANLLANDRVIAWYQGRMEFGPRALGARSILASPIPENMQDRLNDIKSREDFRPVAPVVLEEEAGNWFRGAEKSPYMLFIYDVLPEKAGLIPAVRHVDGTARIQTISRSQHAEYYDVLKAFHERTGVPVLVNTSFNTQGEPIVNTPRDAIECFWSSPLDALVIGPFIVEKPGG